MKKLSLFLPVIFYLASCNNSGMSASSAADSTLATYKMKDSQLQANKATALSCSQNFTLKTLDVGLKDLTPDAVEYGDGTAPPVKGVDSIKAGAKAFLMAFPDMKGENFVVVGEGNKVMVYGEYTATFLGPLMKMKPTKKSFKCRDVDIFTFNDAGKITEHRNITTGASLLAQVGAK